MLWFTSPSSSFFKATKEERREAIERLIEQGSLRSGYYLLLILATLIVTPGIFLGEVSVVIGGMILAPLIIPMLSLSLSLVAGNIKGSLRSIRILLYSLLITIGTSAAFTAVVEVAYEDLAMYRHEINPTIYVFIAFCSGVAGAFAWVKENLAPAIAGVATSVALLPPLCLAGIGIALGDTGLVERSLIIFTANILGITMAAFLVFTILGFLKSGKEEEKIIENAEKESVA